MACKHLERLIYFDRVYGRQCSWEECMACGAQINMMDLETQEAPDRYADE